MSAASTATSVITGPRLAVAGREIPVVLPRLGDPRFKLSATIITLTILGQVLLDFQVSIPQILVTVLLCAAIDITMAYRRDGVLIWPASGIQTGVSVAFIFRVGGTRHGDLWTTRGLLLFVLVVVLSMAPKYLLRINGRHVFNPSNIGLAWALLVIGPSYVFSEHLWWGPLGPGVLFSFVVIFAGAWFLLRQVKMIPMVATFMVTFSVLIGVFALSGRNYWALWHDGVVGGSFYWLTIALSPELLVFAFFMITDPQTAPRSSLSRHIYAAATAVVAAGLILIQTTEFGIKVAILSSLVVTCALVPVFEKVGDRLQSRRSGLPIEVPPSRPTGQRLATLLRNPVALTVAVIAVASLVNTALLAGNDQIELIERGLTTKPVQ